MHANISQHCSSHTVLVFDFVVLRILWRQSLIVLLSKGEMMRKIRRIGSQISFPRGWSDIESMTSILLKTGHIIVAFVTLHMSTRVVVGSCSTKFIEKRLLTAAQHRGHEAASIWFPMHFHDLHCPVWNQFNGSWTRRKGKTFPGRADRIRCSCWQDWDPSIRQISAQIPWYPLCWTAGRRIEVCCSKTR